MATRRLRPYWAWVALSPLAMALESSMDLAQPALMRRIVDEGVAAADPDLIRATGLKMLLCAALGGLGGVLCTHFSARAATGVARDLRKEMFSRIVRFDPATAARFGAGSLTTRLTADVTTVQNAVSMATRGFLRAPMLLCGSIALVLATDWKLAVPLLCMAPVLALVVFRFVSRMVPLFALRQARTDALAADMRENVEGIRVVKSFAKEGRAVAAFSRLNKALARTGLRAGFLGASLGPTLQAVQQATLVVVVFLAAAEADSGLLRAGQVFAIVNWASQVMGSLVMMSFHVMHFSQALVAARRVAEVLQTTTGAENRASADDSPADGSVEFRDVSFGYAGSSGAPALDGVSFKVRAGEKVAIVGATGSGKSTLLALAEGFRRPDGGTVLVGGRDAASVSPGALRSAMGIVPQTSRLFAGTVAWNLRWGDAGASDSALREAAAAAMADSFVEGKPGGYAAEVARGGANFSGGQRQRLAVARALLRRPKLLLLDDATSAVDPATEAALVAGIRGFCPDATVLCVSHRPGTIRAADRVLVLDKGALVGDGTHESLLASCREYREIAGAESA